MNTERTLLGFASDNRRNLLKYNKETDSQKREARQPNRGIPEVGDIATQKRVEHRSGLARLFLFAAPSRIPPLAFAGPLRCGHPSSPFSPIACPISVTPIESGISPSNSIIRHVFGGINFLASFPPATHA